jgi:hypothetical protein
MSDLSFAQFTGSGGPAGPQKLPEAMSLEAFSSSGQPKSSGKPSAGYDFMGLAKRVMGSMAAMRTPDAQAVMSNTPEQYSHTAVEGLKAVASGAAQMEGLVSRGVAGAGTAAVGQGFQKGAQWADKVNAKANQIGDSIMKVNLAPEGKDGEVMSDLVNLLPNGLQKASEYSFEGTRKGLEAIGVDPYHAALGGALSEAGVNGLGTLLMMKPEVASKAVKAIIKSDDPSAPAPVRKLGKQVATAFDALAEKSPETAKDLAEHIEKVDPPVAKKLKVRLKTQKPAEVIGREQVQAQVGDADM